MRFTPKSEEELNKVNLLEAGIYKYEVTEAEDAISDAGNEMIRLKLDIYDPSSFRKSIKDYLLEKMGHKLKHFCESAGLLEKYNSGELMASDLINVSGELELSIEPGKPNPKGGFYPDKNTVKDYLVSDKTKTEANKVNPLDSEDIPF